MKVSQIFNRLSNELEIQVIKAIITLMEENNKTQLEFNTEGGGWKMCFYHAYTMKRLKKIKNEWVVESLYQDDQEGNTRSDELADNAIFPLPDLLLIIEEVERQIEEHEV